MDKIALEEHFSVPNFEACSSSGDFMANKSIATDIERRRRISTTCGSRPWIRQGSASRS